MSVSTETPAAPKTPPRLKQRYRDEIAGELRKEFGHGNVMQIPRLVKITVNMGVGEAARDSKLIDGAVRDLTTITGQKPIVTRATKSIPPFKLRGGKPIGAKGTPRNNRMGGVLGRLPAVAPPPFPGFPRPGGRQ